MRKRSVFISFMLIAALFMGIAISNDALAGCYPDDDGAVYMEYGKPDCAKSNKTSGCPVQKYDCKNKNYDCDCIEHKCNCKNCDCDCKCKNCHKKKKRKWYYLYLK